MDAEKDGGVPEHYRLRRVLLHVDIGGTFIPFVGATRLPFLNGSSSRPLPMRFGTTCDSNNGKKHSHEEHEAA